MFAYLKLFLDICLWRRDPSHVPASASLFVLLAVLYWVSSLAQAWVAYGAGHLVLQASLDLALTLGFFWLVLAVARRAHRYRQTGAALMGTSVLVTPLMMALLSLRETVRNPYPLAVLVWAAMVFAIVWYLFVVGHILRAALDTGLPTAMGVSIAYFLAGAAVAGVLFPPAT
ncbi:MAG: hypothetical protein U1F14_14805 [Steroidobacteraceae bacterium]